MMGPIHIERPVSDAFKRAFIKYAEQLGLKPTLEPHITLIHSTTPVDWDHPAFELDKNPIEIIPTSLHFEMWEPRLVLVLKSEELDRRHQQLRDAGASHDFPDYNTHIKIGKDLDGVLRGMPDVETFRGPIVLGPEVTCETKDFIRMKQPEGMEL
jgi:hypothetical protein